MVSLDVAASRESLRPMSQRESLWDGGAVALTFRLALLR
jgi:hypothetical protein